MSKKISDKQPIMLNYPPPVIERFVSELVEQYDKSQETSQEFKYLMHDLQTVSKVGLSCLKKQKK